MNPAVSFRGVSYRINGNTVLQDLSLDLEAGETLVLLGRSGSGKTTALRMVNGLALPGSGEVLVGGRPTTAWNLVELRRSIGYVIQDGGLFPHYTVSQNVGVIPRLKGWDQARIRARVNELLEQVGLPPGDFGARYPSQLSGGQRQRVGVARALAANPPLLLFDEPFGAVDPVTRVELQRMFLVLRKQLRKTALFVTHDVREALILGTRIGLLIHGRLEVTAPPEEFVRAEHPEAKEFLAGLEWKL